MAVNSHRFSLYKRSNGVYYVGYYETSTAGGSPQVRPPNLVSDGWATHRFKRYVREARLNDKLHFHSLRHTFASWLVQHGVSLYEVQKLLGHSNIAVTQVYSHLQPERLHDIVNKITVSLN